MQLKNVIYEIEKATAVITISRPKALNALNRETLDELVYCFKEIEADNSIMAVIITGAGEKSFVAGADISYMSEFNALEGREFGRLGNKTMKVIEMCSRPVIAAVNGFALGGGCELALACDIRICSENAKFGQPEVNLGVIPGFGGTQRLSRLIGKGLASELLFTGNIIDAQEAQRVGLVNRVVPLELLLDECRKIAEKIATRGPVAVRICKEVIRDGMEMDLARACQHEADLFGVCFASQDQKEGMKAFLEKREPRFTGK